MNLDKTGYLSVNQLNTNFRKDKNVSKPDTSFHGIESETATDGESQKVSAENIKAYYGATKIDLNTEKADINQESEYVTKEEAETQFNKNKRYFAATRYSDFEEVTPFIMTTDGRYSKKALDILTKFNDDNYIVGVSFSLLQNIDVSKTDLDALLKYKDRLSQLFKENKMNLYGLDAVVLNAINKDGSFDENSLNEAIEIIEKYENKSVQNNDLIPLAMTFKDFKDIKSTDELSLTEKKELLTKLVQNPLDKNHTFNQQIYNDIAVLPKTNEEYKSLMSKLIKETSCDVKQLSKSEKTEVISNLENLSDKSTQEISDEISKIFPEIGKVDEATVQTLQKVMKDERFAELSKEDKLTAQLAVILKDASSIDGMKDDKQSAFNAFYLADKLNLPRNNKLKLYALIKNQHLYENSDKEHTVNYTVIRSGYELRHENSMKMFDIINDAKGIQTRTKDNVDATLKKISSNKLLAQNANYEITQTNLPKASQLIENGTSVQKVIKDGIENTVVYFDRKEEPIMYRDTDGKVRQLKPEDVYNYCHATNSLNGLELASRPDSNYQMSSSLMNPTKGTHNMFGQQGVIVKIPKGNVTQERKCAQGGGTGFGKTDDATQFDTRYDLRFDVSDKCAEFDGKQISELDKEQAQELRESLDSMLSYGQYGENISVQPEPIGVFFEGRSNKPAETESNLGGLIIDIIFGKKNSHKTQAEPKPYEFEDVPVDHRKYAEDKDLAVFYLGK